MDVALRGDEARDMAERLIELYFKTQDYPFTRHHIESYDQFLSQDMPAIIASKNPLLFLQDQIKGTSNYVYRAEIYVGGVTGKQIYIGTPTVSLKDSEEVRLLFPNEARLRNLTYSSQVEADIVVRLTISKPGEDPRVIMMDPVADSTNYGYLARYPLFRIPIMLHSRYCLLHGKPQTFLREVGECQYEHGGYFIVNGAEKVLVTHQQQAFNTLYVTKKDSDPKLEIYGGITSLNPKTRQLKRVAFALMRKEQTIQVSLPFVRKPVPLFILFRALGIQSDEDILRLIFPDPESGEANMLQPLLYESILEAHPFLDTFSAVQFIKVFTKGFSEAHVLDILYNQCFTHVENRPGARAAFLADCVRQILRVKAGLMKSTDRDDTRNQRCLTSGVLTRMLFEGNYKAWSKATLLSMDYEYNKHRGIYQDTNFMNLFGSATLTTHFQLGMLTDLMMKGFKGRWKSGTGAGVGEEKTGVIQALSRLSYLDFMSHCRRVVLDFDTGDKAQAPRRLHTSQYGYFCTNETPGGASIGISKNLSILSTISTATDPSPFIQWLLIKAGVLGCDQVTPATMALAVPVYVNAGIVGYVMAPRAILLRDTLKAMKRSGCLPASASVGFSISERRIFVFMDEGRPIRPLIHLGARGEIPLAKMRAARTWRELVIGSLPFTATRTIHQVGFLDPLGEDRTATLENYLDLVGPAVGAIEYVDPYEANESFVANFPEQIQSETSHLEIHPSTIAGLLVSMIPYANFNQSPRNQLSCSQSKQGLSVYATNFPNRFDNQVHVLSYAQAPLCRTIYYDYLADGQMGYGVNLILAMGSFTGYNQDDGIIMNADAIARGMFRSTFYRSYEAFEEDDPMTKTETRIGNPAKIPGWTRLKPGVDYSKLDERGVIRPGELVDENTVLVGRYMKSAGGDVKDSSVTAAVWSRGRVEDVSVLQTNTGLAVVKVRVVQERIPELGDKFSNRHGQKGTIGMLIKGSDMPRRADGVPVDMIMNPHAIPSRMTMAQMMEALTGKAAASMGAVANNTMFMTEGNNLESIGAALTEMGMEPLGEELLYDGMSGKMITSQIFMGNVYTMRLKHMPEDKWNARGAGRREQRTHQPTGGRGAQGGLRIGEMERDAILAHGVTDFYKESIMKRSDAYETYVCNGCGLVPIYNERENKYICPTCDGPVQFMGDRPDTLEVLPPTKRSIVTFSKVEIPYATKLLEQELATFLNMSMRFATDAQTKQLRPPPIEDLTADQRRTLLDTVLQERTYQEVTVPEMVPEAEEEVARPEDLAALGVAPEEEEAAGAPAPPAEEEAAAAPLPSGPPVINLAAASGSALASGPPLAVVPANGLPSVNLQPEAAAEAAGAAAAGAEDGLEEANLGALPLMDEGATAPAAPAAAANQSVQVSTNRPVLVVPVNMAQPPPAQYYQPPAPGAPGTFAVDTSPAALAATTGQQPAAPTNRGRSRSPRGNNGAAPGAVVNVSKVGAAGNNSATPPNVRVNVMKTG
jgi:DNA-directed RNA polymerase II subunit RPB2